MKATLLNLWKENETRVVRYPLTLGVLFVVVASVLGLWPDNGTEALSGFLLGPR